MTRHNNEWEHLLNLAKAEMQAQAAEIESLKEAYQIIWDKLEKLSAERARLKARNTELEWFADKMNEYVFIGEIDTQDSAIMAFKTLQSKCEIYEAALKEIRAENERFAESAVMDWDGVQGIARQALLTAAKIGEGKSQFEVKTKIFNEKCPKCESTEFMIARDMKSTRHCIRCPHKWEPK